MIKRLAGVLALALGTAVFAGTALAGNGHGNGNGNAAAASAAAPVAQSASPGNSANAPGQMKKDAGSATSDPAAQAAGAVGPTPAAPPSGGVKPSNTTTHETHAAASTNQTKLYGNGQTAGQIAVRNGAAPSTVLHGPGNSQPHKAAPCSGGHEVDVHALKAKGHRRTCGTSSGPPASPPNPGPSTEPSHGGDPKAAPGVKPAQATMLPATTKTRSAGHLTSGILGETGGAAGATLPFTGFPLWIAAVLSAALIAGGLVLRRTNNA